MTGLPGGGPAASPSAPSRRPSRAGRLPSAWHNRPGPEAPGSRFVRCPPAPTEDQMDYYDLGAYTRKVTTAVPEAQLWFDRGLNWCFGFNHEEAIACFEKALERDPACAMAHWGIAYAAGPNYNLPWDLLRPGRQGSGARRRLRRHAGRPGPGRRRQPGRARADRGPARALSAARAHRRPVAVERRLCRRHAPGVPGASSTTSRCAPSSPRRSSTGRPGRCGTCDRRASPRAPARWRRARCWRAPSATCPAR